MEIVSCAKSISTGAKFKGDPDISGVGVSFDDHIPNIQLANDEIKRRFS